MTLHAEILNALMGHVVNEMGAAANAALVLVGDRLRLFQTLGDAPEGETSKSLAASTGLSERYLREWLSAQAASGFVSYEVASGRFRLTPEQKAVFADESSPVYMAGGFQSLAAIFEGEPRLAEAFRTGAGIGWGEHCNCLFCGTDRFYRSGYRAHLVAEWLPALDGVVDALRSGIRVADVGCGHGASTAIMAEAFPASTFVGYDVHPELVDEARRQYGHVPNLRFETARAQDYPGSGYGFVTMFDTLHDMGDPGGAATHIRKSLAPGGTLMVVEPAAGQDLADNLHPVGRIYYAVSTSICVPAALGQDGGAALGAQAGEERLAQVLRAGGFASVRKAVATPFNMVLEARG